MHNDRVVVVETAAVVISVGVGEDVVAVYPAVVVVLEFVFDVDALDGADYSMDNEQTFDVSSKASAPGEWKRD